MRRLSAILAVAFAGLTYSCGGGKGSSPPPGGSGGSAGAGGTTNGGAGGSATGGTSGTGGTGGAAGAGGGGMGGSAGAGGAGGRADAAAGGAGGAPGDGGAVAGKTTVVLFLIDGLMADAARTAAANGAANIKFVIDNGVTVQTAHSTSPAARLTLPDNSLPWGNATSGNVAVHTGTHLFEAPSDGMDDIFKAARAAGIKSVFAGGDANYMAFKSADFNYADQLADDVVVQRAIDHVKNDGVRLLRLHLQRIRDDWMGPADKTNPASAYLRHIIASDAQLGRLIQTLKDTGLWSTTYLVVSADHGMGTTSASAHIPAQATSWDPFMAFYGPDIKKGATIPYAELPDIAVTTMRFFNLPALKGHTGNVMLAQKGPTGTVLTNLFVGAPDDIPHPRYVEQYLKMNTFPSSADNYAPYRTAMMGIIK
jgi:hypothetical protein